jgi:hypothetical protein
LDWQGVLGQVCQKHFGVGPEVLVEALRASPNARGYILGSLTELLLRQHLERLGYSIRRIKEKWVGPKRHHGDFYVSADGQDWFVVESKGLKSNAEQWHKLALVGPSRAELENWFERKRSGEIRVWWQSLPPERKLRILEPGAFNRARVLETHFVSGTAGRAGRTIATPRKSEFHVVALDLFLRTGAHEFVFAASHALEPAERHPDHLKQNYLLDIVVGDDAPVIRKPWTRDFNEVFRTLRDPVKCSEMQVDERGPDEREAEVSGETP